MTEAENQIRELGTELAQARAGVDPRTGTPGQARDRLAPLLQYALEAGLLPSPGPSAQPGDDHLECAFWWTLIDGARAGPAVRQIAMRTSLADIHVTLGDARRGPVEQRGRHSAQKAAAITTRC